MLTNGVTDAVGSQGKGSQNMYLNGLSCSILDIQSASRQRERTGGDPREEILKYVSGQGRKGRHKGGTTKHVSERTSTFLS
jgi:hypothetical protein